MRMTSGPRHASFSACGELGRHAASPPSPWITSTMTPANSAVRTRPSACDVVVRRHDDAGNERQVGVLVLGRRRDRTASRTCGRERRRRSRAASRVPGPASATREPRVLQRRLVRLGPAVAEEYGGERERPPREHGARQGERRLRGEEVGDVAEPAHLPHRGPGKVRAAVAQRVHRDAPGEVDVALPARPPATRRCRGTSRGARCRTGAGREDPKRLRPAVPDLGARCLVISIVVFLVFRRVAGPGSPGLRTVR